MSEFHRPVSRRRFLKQSAGLTAGIPAIAASLRVAAGPVSQPARDVAFLSAVDAAQAVRQGEISSTELTQLIFERISQTHKSLNAVVTPMRDEALRASRAADEQLAKGKAVGPLHGVPITIKDSFEVKGFRTTCGSPPLKNHVAAVDSAVVARLRAAGAILLGMTNVSPMLDDWQSSNPVFGQSNNPWDLNRTPGGSTGGGAAALAAGLGYLTPGSDTAGSIRVPAHFCGVYGHKPSYDLVPLRGHIPPRPGVLRPPDGFTVAGPLARSAADLKLAMEIMGGPDGADALAYRWTLPPARKSRLIDYRIGFVLDDMEYPVASDVRRVLVDAIDALRKAGVSLREGWPAGFDARKQYHAHIFLVSESASAPPKETLEEIRARAAKQDVRYRTIEARAQLAPHRDFLLARREQFATRLLWQEYFQEFDALLMPVVIVPAFRHDHSEPWWDRVLETPDGPRKYEDLMFWISLATYAGLPATVAPAGRTTGGLPVGIQIVGPHLEDATPIDVAARMATVLGGFQPPPMI